ncbi:hypothetical protein MUK70_03800 [Dyadobacter chenwenxiniae]|uniref:Uncharacterized protein n=1 Tax=Dyadobacter chenwenxiniae TaxID=2906456 RepID=A0A9X1TPQ2_9BACT|nr:hypothetical protein [Dyadobacter chenwenxiniae]MCF0065743.1 hypothetical protein [Dyadobacter chenwenxiniae]UON84115.1 hypothetical protein MUK70_03800 [Dyadobacter chenwenxiniae]
MESFKCSGGEVEVIPLEFEQVERIYLKKCMDIEGCSGAQITQRFASFSIGIVRILS